MEFKVLIFYSKKKLESAAEKQLVQFYLQQEMIIEQKNVVFN